MAEYTTNLNSENYTNTFGHNILFSSIYRGNILKGMEVTASDPIGMSVFVHPGHIKIDTDNNSYFSWFVEEPIYLEVSNTLTQDVRNDTVVGYIDLSLQYENTETNNPDSLKFIIIQGNENPPTDEMIISELGNNPYAKLANIEVEPNVTQISDNAITYIGQPIEINFSLDNVLPVGSIYYTLEDRNPTEFLGGEWQRFAGGEILAGYNQNDTEFTQLGSSIGETTHLLTLQEMAGHNHTGNTAQNGNHTHVFLGEGDPVSLPIFEYNDRNFTRNVGSIDRGSSWNGQHNHSFTTTSTGGNQAHNNIGPTQVVYIWERIS